jgi:hypothetical protein
MMQAIPVSGGSAHPLVRRRAMVGGSARVSCHIRATSKAEQGVAELPSAEQRMRPDLHVWQFAQVTAFAQVDFPS